MKNLLLLSIISIFSSCTYFNFVELDEAKQEAAKQCQFEVDQAVISSCEKGVSFFAYAGLSSPEVSGDEEKIKSTIIDLTKKASSKCDAHYGDDDRALVACDIGVKIAANKARQLFLTARVESRESSTSELAINGSEENNMPQQIVSDENIQDSVDVISI